ncbi:hypothetical protein K435DRAFT_660203, partial [Dendrothele bispora CBS 962.96]
MAGSNTSSALSSSSASTHHLPLAITALGNLNLETLLTSSASRIASDLWYEQARTGLNRLVRKRRWPGKAMAAATGRMRDYGKGMESQAWGLIGMAVRMGQEMELDLGSDSDSGTSTGLGFTLQEYQIRSNVWGVTVLMDLVLSLQLGRSPGTVDCLKALGDGSSKMQSSSGPSSSALASYRGVNLTTHRFTLAQIISRINLYLYLG